MKHQKQKSEKFPFDIAPKIKYLGINLTKDVDDLRKVHNTEERN